MNETEAYNLRLAQVRKEVPGLFQAKTVLYVGATPRRFQLGRELFEAGCTITLLEAHQPFAAHYEGHPWLNDVVCGDVRGIPGILNGRFYDAVVWWHGPEHVNRDELPDILAAMEARAGMVVLGCPWGRNDSGMVGGNPYARHLSTLDISDLEGLGYQVRTLGVKDRPDTWCHMLAWRAMAPRAERVDVVYTALFGGYDTLHPVDSPILYICFTDADITADGWEIIKVRRRFISPQMEARMYKFLAHQHLLAGVSVWQDANGLIAGDPGELMDYLGGRDLALFAHPERDCIYQEANAVIALGKAPAEDVLCQTNDYRMRGYPAHNGLAATGLLVRRHTPQVERLNEAWWSELTRHTLRDQLSFNYVCWKLGVEYSTIPGDLYQNNIVSWQEHSRSR